MIDVPILLADIERIIKLAVLFIFIVGPLIGKLLSARNAARPKPARPRIPPLPEAGQGGPKPDARERLEAEVERYLQDAGLRPQMARVDEPVEEPVTAELIVEDPHRGASLAEHVRGHIDPSPLHEHATRLGKGLKQADESMEQHLHQVFDHDVGHLPHDQQKVARIAEGTDAKFWSDQPGNASSRSQPSHSAAEIAEAIRTPEGFRQAIILGEILKRREF